MHSSEPQLAPVILFVYNRPDVTFKTLSALKKNDLSDQTKLYIFCDGPKQNASSNAIDRITETRRVIRAEQWCGEVEINEQKKNQGLANSIIDGVQSVISQHGKAIVLEDDLITGKGFLRYMNDALLFYQDIPKVFGITGFKTPGGRPKNQDTFFLPIMNSSSWATWEDRWNSVNFDGEQLLLEITKSDRQSSMNFNGYPFVDMLERQVAGKIDSWAIRFYSSMFLQEKIFLYPAHSLVRNIGFQLDATNSRNKHVAEKVMIETDYVSVGKIPVEVDKRLARSIKLDFSFLRRKWNGLKRRTRKILGLPEAR